MQFYARKRRVPVINIVSLIDILTLLLIFMVVTTTFKKADHVLQIKLPESATAQKSDKPREPVIIFATKDSRLLIGEQEVKLSELAAALRYRKSADPSIVFALKADTDVPLGFFVKVLDASKEAGVGNLSLFTEEAQKNTPPPSTP